MIVVYEDERTIAFLPARPIVPGHVRIIPKEAFRSIEDVPEGMAAHYFMVAGSIASALFDGMGAEGTNIIMNDGPVSPEGTLSIDVIPRKQGDGRDFKWEGKKQQDKDLEEARKKITWEFIPPEMREKTEIVQSSAVPIEKPTLSKDDYLIQFYRKIP